MDVDEVEKALNESSGPMLELSPVQPLTLRTRFCKVICIIPVLIVLLVVALVAFLVCKLTPDNEPFQPPVPTPVPTELYIENRCIYSTADETKTYLQKNPFGDRCDLGSAFVNNTCAESGVLCEECKNGMLLPRYCFCDPKVHCVRDQIDGMSARDANKSYNCSVCQRIFKESMYESRAENVEQCRDVSDRRVVDSPTCKDGYKGVMCNIITKRICQEEDSQPQKTMKACKEKGFNGDECFIKISKGTYHLCQSLKDIKKENWQNLKECSVR